MGISSFTKVWWLYFAFHLTLFAAFRSYRGIDRIFILHGLLLWMGQPRENFYSRRLLWMFTRRGRVLQPGQYFDRFRRFSLVISEIWIAQDLQELFLILRSPGSFRWLDLRQIWHRSFQVDRNISLRTWTGSYCLLYSRRTLGTPNRCTDHCHRRFFPPNQQLPTAKYLRNWEDSRAQSLQWSFGLICTVSKQDTSYVIMLHYYVHNAECW